jgi:hypothetical protein
LSLGFEVIKYAVIYDVVLEILILPIGTLIESGPRSNLNFVHHVLESFSHLRCRKYSIVFLPLDIPKIFYLKHYTAESGGWTSNLLCDRCISVYKKNLQKHIFGCNMSENCK